MEKLFYGKEKGLFKITNVLCSKTQAVQKNLF